MKEALAVLCHKDNCLLNLFFNYYYLGDFNYVYGCMHGCVPWHTYGGHRTPSRSWLSPSTMGSEDQTQVFRFGLYLNHLVSPRGII